jgi:ferredoxin
MPAIRVVNSRVGADREAVAEDGGALVDICDEARLPIPFSCRSASCATCHVLVLEGGELLEPPEEEERDLLEFISAPAGSRLACQVRLKAGAGTLVLKPV